MKFLTIIVAYITLILMNMYLMVNIINIQGGSLGLSWLFAVILLGGMFTIFLTLFKVTYLRRSLLFLSIFYIYFILHIAIDIPDPSAIWGYVFGTTSGTLLFYVLGFFMAIIINRLLLDANSSRWLLRFSLAGFTVYNLSAVGMILFAISGFATVLRSDIFLIQAPGTEGLYQRPGDFLSIAFLIQSLVFYRMQMLVDGRSSFFRICIYYIFTITYVTIYIISMMTAQMIGSNKGFLAVAAVGLVTLTFLFAMRSDKLKKFLNSTIVYPKHLFAGLVLKRFLSVFALVLIFSGLLIWGVMTQLDISLQATRVMSFGDDSQSPLSSRMDILQNFHIHFLESPVLGNMNVDAETTGDGSYVHSLLGSLLTHTGILGFLFFLSYVFCAIKELLANGIHQDGRYPRFISNGDKIFFFSIFLVLFGIATIGTFLTWAPLWFGMGLLFQAVIHRSRLSHHEHAII